MWVIRPTHLFQQTVTVVVQIFGFAFTPGTAPPGCVTRFVNRAFSHYLWRQLPGLTGVATVLNDSTAPNASAACSGLGGEEWSGFAKYLSGIRLRWPCPIA